MSKKKDTETKFIKEKLSEVNEEWHFLDLFLDLPCL